MLADGSQTHLERDGIQRRETLIDDRELRLLQERNDDAVEFLSALSAALLPALTPQPVQWLLWPLASPLHFRQPPLEERKRP